MVLKVYRVTWKDHWKDPEGQVVIMTHVSIARVIECAKAVYGDWDFKAKVIDVIGRIDEY
jgi:hypothetical protein